jgi:hypothetical protein
MCVTAVRLAWQIAPTDVEHLPEPRFGRGGAIRLPTERRLSSPLYRSDTSRPTYGLRGALPVRVSLSEGSVLVIELHPI